MFRWVIFSCLFLATFAASGSRHKPSQERIVGGFFAQIKEVPYLVSVLYCQSHECGGSIIGAKHILTAAHCFENRHHAFFSIRAGSSFHWFGGIIVEVIQIKIHPMFDVKNAVNDAAILVLKEPLTFNEKVQPVPLADVEPEKDEMVLISGWGAMREGDYESYFLESVSVPVVSKKLCKKRYKANITVTDEMFCAGYPIGGKDACQGDSGGPAVVKGKLAGIVSWGDGCAKKNSPGIYTNVARLQDWIAEETRE